jgi:hypothetical protein
MVVHAGPGEESGADADTIWSHAWDLDSGKDLGDGTGSRIYDGVTINEYTIQPEYFLTPGDSTIGVFTHEFGHVLGLPDLYDTSYATDGVGQWSLMAAGSWNGPGMDGSVPAPLLAWEKARLGWISLRNASWPAPATIPSPPESLPIPLIIFGILILTALYASKKTGTRRALAPLVACSLILAPAIGMRCGGGGGGGSTSPHVILEDVDSSAAAARVALGDPYGDQYYLIENKHRKPGTWSAHLPGEGLLVTHIDDYIVDELLPYNAVNSYSDLAGGPIHGVGIVEADGDDDLFIAGGDLGSPTDPFFAENNDELTPLTQPGSLYNRYTSTNIYPRSTASRVYITGISAIGESMSFDCVRK